MKKDNPGMLQLLLLCALAAVLAFAVTGCPSSDDSLHDIGNKTDQAWLLAATPFMLQGETAANNIKISWSKRSGVNRYEVWRDGVFIAHAAGTTIDDYNLPPDTSHQYFVKAFLGKNLVASSAEISVSTFTPAAARVWVYANLTGTRTYTSSPPASPSGFLFSGTYYRYQYRASGGNALLEESTSADGLTGWSGWRTACTVSTFASSGTTGAKLEGVVFQKVGNKVICTAHREESGSTYNLGHFFLAAIEPDGINDFTVTFDERPMGKESRDQSVFVDTADGNKAYALCSGLSDLNIILLKDDWSEPLELTNTVFAGQSRETPHIVHSGDMYHIYSSRQNGWYPTQTKYATAASLDGEFSVLKDIGNQGSFGSQFNRVEEYNTTANGTSYGLWGYRWAANWDGNAKEASNIQRMVPLTVNGDFSAAEYFPEVAYYADYGLVGIQSGQYLSLGAPVIMASSASPYYANTIPITDGSNNSTAGFFRGGEYPYTLILDLGTPAALSQIALTCNLTYGSDTAYMYRYHGSTDGATWVQLVDGSANYKPGFLMDFVTDATEYRYVRMTVNGLRDVRHTMNAANWADGVIEFAVYGTPAQQQGN